ncbi:MAG: hypothetical protein II975_03110 [Bacteroidales bacterium]|nr:hypothetical protein [Bacteroidales bacterium]MBQ6741838.1 hypothetical protein [Bacteroidales bacterium]
MKKQFITVALFAALCSMAVSCQKESFNEPQMGVAQNDGVRTMIISVDEFTQVLTFRSEDERYRYLEQMAALAREGHVIRIANAAFQHNANAAKETVTYTTPSHPDAIAWCTKMSDDGYQTTMIYNQDTKMYICVATK